MADGDDRASSFALVAGLLDGVIVVAIAFAAAAAAAAIDAVDLELLDDIVVIGGKASVILVKLLPRDKIL